ncbi:MAG: Asp-tRNA(Asn)/Glu-tRNA(Gln) amidotransferase GatCAB subunit C [Chloroflexi bacterium]|nr:Asp-tRNA(Asn)/Glu-tRNA(Gln) amidotransferase GatCAB subunit C [Chloroflexota bacterium]|tara:strand:+ start:4988 stop:5278 length:291 start_codon:yes stop_codon:yes gene_type:complete
MAEIKKENIKHIARLSYLHLSEKELELMQNDLNDILDKFQKLSTIDTENTLPTGHPSDVFSEMREDKESESLSKDEVLQNAPNKNESFIIVKPVLD